ncbi:7,8-dihydropterin-6-yl-methyl-4-(beta-D-ribofuranosyl)aminobenzene 5'-phosphate synthase [Marinitoga hydrogenitolerans DSM 16785]|uniref:7,8-dihydropterin-6-yl-methyl-4-(Beta-D-ribofuranosyl)aminobenzene 5'-phosphate synthase n=1 Tax=Marinitoga hydrogenitolerans (strain DSM 16785 / JCM 12826 / AT1271) TaxID=1122195 RepID=A0A1M4W4M5_MARH1|nr:MBL fold metallo-hydrolase [Marinitoga hydrogenitolerans]SHE76188.1 7,8-dihydropterin-6-yl-methyl-4-(beta-D-ribofuranosyl)aminobenzene 5'-phosphate synthase [Marinitoga hydrogenitolerans DSM 16785]
MKITGIVDNFKVHPLLKRDWGFSVLIEENGRKMLFDTGNDYRILEHNMKHLGMNFKNIDYLFLSHFHNDHTGGLEYIFENFEIKKTFIPDRFPNSLMEKIKNNTEIVECKDKMKIDDNLYSTGTFTGDIAEHSLVIKTDKGLVVIAGCAHPKIENILNYVKESFSEKLHAVIGGFHFYKLYEEKLFVRLDKIKKTGVEFLLPSHCTGIEAINAMNVEFKGRIIKFGAGTTLEI